MQRTIGYNYSVTIPVTIEYNCSKCQYLNVKTINITEKTFGTTKYNAHASAVSALNERIKNLQNSADYNNLKEASIVGKCCKCNNIEKWSARRLSQVTWMRILIALFLALVLAVSCSSIASVYSESSSTYPVQAQTKIGLILLFIFTAGVAISAYAYIRKLKTVDIPEQSKPIIVAVGVAEEESKEGIRLQQLSLFMETEKKRFFRTIRKCRNTTKIYEITSGMQHFYPEVFTPDLLEKINKLSQDEQIDGTDRRSTAIKQIEEYLEKEEEERPIVYLNYLKNTV